MSNCLPAADASIWEAGLRVMETTMKTVLQVLLGLALIMGVVNATFALDPKTFWEEQEKNRQ